MEGSDRSIGEISRYSRTGRLELRYQFQFPLKWWCSNIEVLLTRPPLFLFGSTWLYTKTKTSFTTMFILFQCLISTLVATLEFFHLYLGIQDNNIASRTFRFETVSLCAALWHPTPELVGLDKFQHCLGRPPLPEQEGSEIWTEAGSSWLVAWPCFPARVPPWIYEFPTVPEPCLRNTHWALRASHLRISTVPRSFLVFPYIDNAIRSFFASSASAWYVRIEGMRLASSAEPAQISNHCNLANVMAVMAFWGCFGAVFV